MAYPTTRGDIVGAPAWVFSEHYDVAVSAGRLLVDRTGLTGNYEFTLVYRLDTGRPPDPGDERPNIFTALQEQLGLKLVSARAPIDVLVIDSIERPPPD